MDNDSLIEEIMKVLEEHDLLGAIMYCLSPRERKSLVNKLNKAILQTA